MRSLVANSLNTPLRRRSALNVSLVSSPMVNINNHHLENVNDDEAERRTSRRIETNDSGNLNEAADSLNNCLKLFAENKISKDNAWTLNIIDSFSKLVKKHHHSLSNFQVCGSTLEASAKVYSLRVDSVYTDVLRMSADLSRRTAKALTKKNRMNQGNEEEENESGNEVNDKENADANNQTNVEGGGQKQKKTAKKRRHVSTVTKNPETLNGRLETHPLVDPFFAKLNSMVGDINSSKRLMQNIIPTKGSNLKLRQNMKIWDNAENFDLNLDEEFDYHKLNLEVDIFTLKSVSGSVENTLLRTELKSYRICDLPLETAEEADTSIHLNDNDEMNDTVRNASNIGLQFDINAPVESIPNERSFVMDYGELNEHDFEDLNDEAMVAIERCKGLKRQPIVIEDMQPDSVVHLEYSYRPLDMIDQFWAGPSHWKFRQSRRTHASILSRASQTTNSSIQTQNAGQKIKTVRKKKTLKKVEVTLDDFLNIDDNDVIMPISKRMKANQLSIQTMTKRWDSKKLKLPIDYRTPNDIFDIFKHASSIQIASNPDTTFNGNDENAPLYDYNNENDRNYCSRIPDPHSDTETETNTDIGPMDDNNMEFDNVEMPPPPALIEEIPDFYIGAPERIEKISIAFAKRAKVVDMRQLKQCSWNIISKKNSNNPLRHPCFSETLNDLPKVLNKTMAENMSMPLAFYAILHLCNDKGLLLKPNNTLRDFEIEFVNKLMCS
ncbi:hypothetical protein PVAND_011599 [Polypedilum vanderplanki]|uniref:Condensin complex subunit 2 n=1 Tax=Polypedilum vanderplanki TaxID=319348 RepID=A0A9J6CJ35_POLVA|nr:hypothetical protein PVAND_011599 [Polypedilum vanderplanki]